MIDCVLKKRETTRQLAGIYFWPNLTSPVLGSAAKRREFKFQYVMLKHDTAKMSVPPFWNYSIVHSMVLILYLLAKKIGFLA